MSVPPPGVRFTRLSNQDAGKTVRAKVGEELHITLDQPASGSAWGVKGYPRGALSYVQTYSTAADPNAGTVATQTFVFMLLQPGQGTVALAAGTVSWSCSVQVT